MSLTAYPTLRLKLTMPQALKLRFLPAVPGTNAGNSAAAAAAAAAAAEAAAAVAVAATTGKVDKAGDTMTGLLTLSADPMANLHAATKQYVDTTIVSTSGTVNTSGSVVATQLAGYADTTGDVIRGVTVGAGLDMSAGTTLQLDSDLSAIAALTGINVIYYRSSDGIWSSVTIGTGLTFAGGTLSATAAGNVSSTGTPSGGQFARWASASTIEGISAATALTAIGAQPLDGDLTALAALSGTNNIYYRSAADTWSPVLIGANMSFSGGTLSSSGSGGTGVAAVGTPTAGQIARWTTATTIEGVSLATAGIQPLDTELTALASVTSAADQMPYFTGSGTAALTTVTTAARTVLDDTTTANMLTTLGGQPLDAELSALAGLTSAADQLPYFTGSGTAALTTLTSTARTLLDDTSTAAMLTTLGAAPLASPTFTGDPKAPTPSAGDNDTSIATTAFVTAAALGPPQGRLTLQAATPVMTTTQSAATTIYYTPYVGNKVPIYDGTGMVMRTFAELSVLTTDTTKNPAAIGAAKINDWFVWNDAGTIRLGHGPDWTDDTTRSAGTTIVRVNGIWVNSVSITNGPPGNGGTYIGTTRSNVSSQLFWTLPTAAAGGGGGWFAVWNAYNRVPVHGTCSDTTSSWTYGSTTYRARNANSNNFLGIVTGLAADPIVLRVWGHAAADGSGNGAVIGIGVDSTSSPSGTQSQSPAAVSAIGTMIASHSDYFLGNHFFFALEAANNAGAPTWYGILTGPPSRLLNGLSVEILM